MLATLIRPSDKGEADMNRSADFPFNPKITNPPPPPNIPNHPSLVNIVTEKGAGWSKERLDRTIALLEARAPCRFNCAETEEGKIKITIEEK